MLRLSTPCGEIIDPIDHRLHPGGAVRTALLSGPTAFRTPAGVFEAQHEATDARRRHQAVDFHPNGMPRTLPLQRRVLVPTPAGELPAELVTFHPSGRLKRVFPLNGRLSGFWTWQNEHGLAEETELDTPAGRLRARLIAIQFYESGRIKSLTLWPGETVDADSPAGRLPVRVGLAFHESGAVRSLEPASPVEVATPIGRVLAFDNDPLGITGDVNSLRFDPDGRLEGLATATDRIHVTGQDQTRTFEPPEVDSMCGGLIKVVRPIALSFGRDEVVIDGEPFRLDGHAFRVEQDAVEGTRIDYQCD
jgi:hypothetical protein